MTLLNTDRLLLDFISENDAPFLHQLMNNPSFIKNIGDRNIKTIGDAKNFIKSRFLKSYKHNGYGYYIIKIKETNEPIGFCGLVNRIELDIIDIGYALLPKFTSKGFAFEATKALYNYAQQTLNIPKIAAIIEPTNTKSLALIKKLGLKYKKKVQLPEEDIECLLYSN
ncbi:N-acetyltransferase [Aureibaculum marinum]|uniref:N-acetyltransferase n=1 Tax=Aureibaculum marinum TaxID=2487930 RepID=A0A3N4NN68_9FLAO|nr:GNAT family N-acetyltransferase [Aureibaculum marinum]RPD97701.1 N-acetyltransferase [Aureibaculum marinum]